MALIIGNWKMHLSVADSALLLERLSQAIEHSDNDIVLCPSFPALYSLYQAIQQKGLDKLFELGAQNMYFAEEGAFTGEVSPLQLKDFVRYVIIGHSERRHVFGETDELIAKKVEAALRYDLVPILCVGETLAEHEQNETKRLISSQLEVDLSDVTAEEIDSIVIAYEPVWAIGTGNYAKPEDVAPVIAQIRDHLATRFGGRAAEHSKVLYGGSVDAENAGTYLKIDKCDGLLVGGASLNYETFARIANA